MKDAILIGLLIVIAILLLMRRASSFDTPSSCNSKLVHKDAVCANIFPGKFPNNGPLTADGQQKYCCK